MQIPKRGPGVQVAGAVRGGVRACMRRFFNWGARTCEARSPMRALAQAKLIRDKLQEVKDAISAVRAAGGSLEPVPDDEEGRVEVIQQAGTSTSTSATASAGASSSSAAAAAAAAAPMSGLSADAAKAAAEALEKNPELAKQAQEMMASMSDEQLRGIASQFNVDATPAQMRANAAGSRMPANMTAAQMESIMKLQRELPEMKDPSAAKDPAVLAKAAEVLSANPDMVKNVSSMVSACACCLACC